MLLQRFGALAAVSLVFGLSAAAQEPKEVSGREQSRKIISQVKPVYPPDAKAAGVQGTVRLEAVIGTEGKVQKIRTVSGPPELIPSALEAVKQWVYEPTVLNGAPVAVITQIDVNYTLTSGPAAVAEAKSPMEVSGSQQQLTLVDKVRPTYPPEAKAAGIEGLVRLEAVIGADGGVKAIRTVSGPPELIDSALDAVRQWTYQPTLLNGAPVEVVTQIDVNYTLSR